MRYTKRFVVLDNTKRSIGDTVYKLKYRDKEYEIYTEEEAKKLDLTYVYWRDAGVDAEYMLGDDGNVIPILSATKWKNGLLAFDTPFGRITKYKKIVRNPKSTDERWNAFWKGDNNPIGILTEKKRLFVEWYIRLGGDHVDAYRRTHPGCSEKNIKVMAKRLLAHREVKTYMAKQLGGLLDELGVDEEFIIKGYLELFNDGEVADGTRKAALDKLSLFRGMEDIERKEEAIFALMPEDEMEALNKEKKQKLESGDDTKAITDKS